MSSAVHVTLTGVLILATAVWVGGFVAIVVVAQVARRTLRPTERVAFFRALGRAYGIVGGLALLVGLVAGAALLAGHPWDGLRGVTTVVAGLLVVTTAVGVAQARRLTRLRRRVLIEIDNALLVRQVRREAVGAGLLRAGIGALSVVLVVLGVVLAA